MAKSTSTLTISGYSHWGVRRTLREALNAARWSPWSAIAWMEEARNMLTIENSLFDEYDDTARRINALWTQFERHHWYESGSFWKKGNVKYPPQRIKLYDEAVDWSTPTFSL
jgi:hypothetical protein